MGARGIGYALSILGILAGCMVLATGSDNPMWVGLGIALLAINAVLMLNWLRM